MMRALPLRPRLTAVVAALSVLAASAASASAATPSADTTFTKHGAWSFTSAPNLNPPRITTDAPTRHGLSSGFFFVGNFKNITIPQPFTGQSGPLILDSHLQPVYFKPVSGQFVNNLTTQTYDGKPALSWWQGVVTNTGATTSGEDVVVGQNYRTIHTLKGAEGWVITQHEMRITGHDAWVTANKVVPVPAGSVPNCPTCVNVVDSAVQEYDLTNGHLLYTWSALANIPLTASQQPASPAAPAYDAYHINSVQLLSGGRFLVSLRNTWAGYLIQKTGSTSKTLWTIGGPSSTFALPSNGVFHWQHDIEMHSLPHGVTEVSVFDDGCCEIVGPGKFGAPNNPSRGLLLKLNSNNTASYVHQYVHPTVAGAALETAFQGNMQLLRNGNVVIGWGSAPFFSEYTNSGKLLFDARMPNPDVTYRAYVSSWVGKPPVSDMRQVAKTDARDRTTIYVTWDGATQVASWRVLGGSSSKHLTTIATGAKRSFETAIRLKKSYSVYQVQALDSRGHRLGTSKTFTSASSVCNPCGGY